jgi:hypothetical protein
LLVHGVRGAQESAVFVGVDVLVGVEDWCVCMCGVCVRIMIGYSNSLQCIHTYTHIHTHKKPTHMHTEIHT